MILVVVIISIVSYIHCSILGDLEHPRAAPLSKGSLVRRRRMGVAFRGFSSVAREEGYSRVQGLCFWVQGFGLRVFRGFGFRLRVQGSEFRDCGFRAQGKVQGAALFVQVSSKQTLYLQLLGG